MTQLFGHQYDLYPFQLFSVMHLVMLLVFVTGSVLLYVYRKPLKSLEKPMKVIMFSGLFILELFYHIWLFSGKAWEISFTLPLQLCSISLLLCLILLITDSKFLFQVVYFLGIAGAIQALVTPELFVGFPHFRFFQFFITHMLIIWVALFYAFVKEFRITRKGLWQAFAFLNIAAGFAFLANKLTGGNYMFLASKPSNLSLLDYLGPYPYYILVLECIALLLFWVLYLPWRGAKK
ncbi:TIGR02206 family membrane protein [Robertmurraya yapensis]|uniref:TIGR02206 family membrane protein n=1 Tax=Bacillus yapensis TaxID=2492960 RepID=A0A3S0IMF3_9BACI|nr:TIGR02206 family membrane protein [Bacillus yapensis]RTR35706.1 TIGR02206 family membrane protein [Bacillus yapensis]TKS98508.1 TIGR02206 family membrane protein [Bacillus yapensis]